VIRTDRSQVVAGDVVGFAQFPCDRDHWQRFGCGEQPTLVCLECFVMGDYDGMEWEVIERGPEESPTSWCSKCGGEF
jgi:hypothetical protein